MGIGSFILEEIGRNKRKRRLFLFLFPLLKREDEREKSIIKSNFSEKNLSYYFQKVKSLRKLSEFSKTPHFSPKLSFIIKTNPETDERT